MPEANDLANIRREAFLRALFRAAQNQLGTVITVASLAQELGLHIPQLNYVIAPVLTDGLITLQGGLDSGTISITEKGMSEANEVLNKRSPLRAKTKILFIDTEPESMQRLKDAGYSVFDVSMGYRTGKRGFSFPAPNEVSLMVCDLRRPACFDSKDWGPGRSNNNFKCKIIPYEHVNSSFYVTGERRHAQHQLIYETQLPKHFPGTFGPKEINRAIVEGGVPFLMFLNPEWVNRIEVFPNWLDVKWSFLPTSATQVGIAEPLPTLLPELGKEIKFKLAIQNRFERGPLFTRTPPLFPTSVTAVVSNNIGDVFGQFVKMGKGSVFLLPATHQNVDVTELFASRLDVVRQLALPPQRPLSATKEAALKQVLAAQPRAEGEVLHGPNWVPKQAETTERPQMTARDVFVIHGRDERLRSGMFQFLRSLDLNPIEWTQAVALTGKAAPYVGEVLDAAFSHAQAVVVLFTPDDLARLRPDLCGQNEPSHEIDFTHQARPNVLFESGMAMARHPERTVLVEIGALRPFSDIGGRHTIRMDNSPRKRQELAQRLQKAGCAVNLTGTDWQTAGDLTPPEVSTTAGSMPSEPTARNSTVTNRDVLADVISELEDNLERARVPRIGDAYARPSSEAWRNNRNRLTLPNHVRSELTNIYRQIESWRTIVHSGVHPNMGSPALDGTTASLRTQLPSLIEELKKLL